MKMWASAMLVIVSTAITGATAHAAPIIITTGQTVTGTTHNITLTSGSITPNLNTVSLSNSGGNLVVSFKSTNGYLLDSTFPKM